jgi:hypothetical protein
VPDVCLELGVLSPAAAAKKRDETDYESEHHRNETYRQPRAGRVRERRPEADVRGVEEEDGETADELPHLVAEQGRFIVVGPRLEQADDDEPEQDDKRDGRRRRFPIGRARGALDPPDV